MIGEFDEDETRRTSGNLTLPMQQQLSHIRMQEIGEDVDHLHLSPVRLLPYWECRKSTLRTGRGATMEETMAKEELMRNGNRSW